MRAIVNTPKQAKPVAIREFAEPQPAPNQALISVKAVSLNRGELTLLANRPDGWRPGQDVAGIVVQVAKDGSGPAVGTRVVGLVDNAGWSERVAVATTHLAALPDNVTFAEAATLPVAGITALRVVEVGGALVERKVLVTGASGAVGQFAVQIAVLAGAHVTAISGSNATLLRDLGAHDVIADVAQAEGFYDLILESVGGESLTESIKHIAPDGVLVIFGNSSRQTAQISFENFAPRHGARIQAYFSYLSGPPESYGADLSRLSTLLASGKLKTTVDRELDWEAVVEGIAALRDRKVAGKVVFTIGA